MKYNNESVLRQNRTIDESVALELLRTGEYGVLSMADVDGGGYGVPLNYAWDGEDAIYMHCAVEGRKLRNIAADPRVTFAIMGPTHVIPEKFTTERSSIVLHGRATAGLSDEEKMKALMLLVEKFCSNVMEKGRAYAEATIKSGRVEIIRLDVDYYTGKGKLGMV